MRDRVITFLRSWGLVLLLTLGGLGVALHFVAPPPPRLVRIATGPTPDSAYAIAAEAYARALERVGFQVRRVTTQGSVENLAKLRANEVDFALVQGGVADPARDAGLESLGAVFFEPIWLFTRGGGGIERVTQVRGRRAAVGPEGSGTRALALALLAANGIAPEAVTLSPRTGIGAAEALIAGEVDAALFVAAAPGPGINRLMRAPGIGLIDFSARAEAYAATLPYLTPVRLPLGGVSLSEDLPPQATTLLAPAASLIAREAVHPQLVALLVGILQETHRGRQMFAAEGRFPSPLNQDLPLNRDARRYYERGPTFLQSWLPFWVAVSVERLWVLLIPILGVALPLFRFAPMLYAWQMENRVYRHYTALRSIEAELEATEDPAARQALLAELDALERRVVKVGVPGAFRRHVYALRRDINDVRLRLAA
jgi:TRAP transporter TAXI family solute receptor